ncbi:hypothetical protein CAPTEDRAFT_149628 [Capitella teleta]|uniref:Tetraspanin n=1 Tax=Capitella teleta TaxID=283909 RepID=R7TK09_CAPTE|nr:hypothetical protein CAPTEDRAFT_149628 [Capitella teleta]|eukprot:ELT91861.1 hypothetical protein CAPTEDRAFT_149628 [Capitella teleta]
MGLGGFTCSKNALAALNVLYIMVAFILIGVAAYGKAAAYIATIEIMGGIIACGVFLLLISIIGLIGAVKHHQVLLFFYMIVLFILFLIQFAVACAMLALNEVQRKQIAKWGWARLASDKDQSMLDKTQRSLDCCGFEEPNLEKDHPACGNVSQLACCSSATAACCTGVYAGNSTDIPECPCDTCWKVIGDHMNEAVKTVGGISLFFSFTEMIGVWLALKYRNLKDPRANPSAFL